MERERESWNCQWQAAAAAAAVHVTSLNCLVPSNRPHNNDSSGRGGGGTRFAWLKLQTARETGTGDYAGDERQKKQEVKEQRAYTRIGNARVVCVMRRSCSARQARQLQIRRTQPPPPQRQQLFSASLQPSSGSCDACGCERDVQRCQQQRHRYCLRDRRRQRAGLLIAAPRRARARSVRRCAARQGASAEPRSVESKP
jgi:hypothetical protein